MTSRKCLLFLQGPPGLFWPRLAEGFEAAGCRTLRVNLNFGDLAFWPRRGALNYRGTLADWPAWLAALLDREGVTDILYYADRLPYHVAALDLARTRGIRVHAIEYGYLRPDWLTIEAEAMGRFSTFPRDPDAIRALAGGHPDPDLRPLYTHGFWDEAVREVTWNLLMVFGRAFYPFYRSDKYYWPVAEYLSWLVRFAARTVTGPRDEAMVDRLLDGDPPYNLVALQLQMDYQIRASSDFRHIEDMLDLVMASFARSAPKDRHLVVKTHPLDSGLELWPLRLRRLARAHGLTGRVHLVDSLRLAALISASKGVVLANSTVGLYAIAEGAPVVALADAVYNVPGVTHQSGLDAFWSAPESPDPFLARDLIRALAAHIQVKGSFFNPDGQKAAIREIVAKLTA